MTVTDRSFDRIRKENRMFVMLKRFAALLNALLIVIVGNWNVGYTLRYKDFTDEVSFASVSADDLKVTDEEKQRAREWYEENVLYAGSNGKVPAYTFSVGGIPLKRSLDKWSFSVGESSAKGEYYRGGITDFITLSNKKNGIRAEVEATFYEDSAACEWTVKLMNTGEKRSRVISDFQAIEASLPVSKADIYMTRGSDDEPDDFTMLKAKHPRIGVELICTEGRGTAEYLPYFNLSGENGGVVVAGGWSGLWSAGITGGKNRADVRFGQARLRGYLEPGESIRSPLVSVLFYGGSEPTEGFNAFRSWMTDSVMPEGSSSVVNCMDVFFVSSTRTAGEMLRDINALPADVTEKLDYLWMDAGWYCSGSGDNETWSNCVGNWVVPENRFPDGIKAISDRAAEFGAGLLLWYEPERVNPGTIMENVGREHDGWLVYPAGNDNEENIMWNLGNSGACEWLIKYISDSLIENGVSVYRQDFNYDPAHYWRTADRKLYGGRTGFAENFYMTGLYAYLDGLLEAVPGLVIDNCASGGRRLDLEMCRRGVPMWRSDYNCDQTRPDLLNATQAQTYGLSFWLPVSGTFSNFSTEYAARTSIIPMLQVPMVTTAADLNVYRSEREAQLKNFFPLSFGGTDEKGITAMQYGDEQSGCALIYKHSKADPGAFDVYFSGLSPDALYTVTDIDSPDREVILSGERLMDGEYSVTLCEGEKAYVIRYAPAAE